MNEKETNTRRKRLPFEDAPASVRRAVAAGALLAAGSAAAVGVHEAYEANTPHFHGEHTVTITEDTVNEIAMDHVDGAENNIRATVDKIVKMNPDVFQNGKAFVDSEDIGKTITVPDSVE